MAVLGTNELGTVSRTVFRKFPPASSPPQISYDFLIFPIRIVPSTILPTHLRSRNKHFLLSSCCKTPVQGNPEPSWDGKNVSIQQLTRRYVKCQKELGPTCFYCATLINQTSNREIRSPSRKAVHLQTTDQHNILLGDLPQ